MTVYRVSVLLPYQLGVVRDKVPKDGVGAGVSVWICVVRGP